MRRTVVVIDDNRLARLLVGDALRAMGYEPVTYAAAAEALVAMRRDPPAACIVDQTMPNMTGAEFIRELRRSSDRAVSSIPVIGLTGGSAGDLLEAGASLCLKKPLSEDGLGGALDAAISGRLPRDDEGRPSPGGEGVLSASRALAEIQWLHRRYQDGQLSDAEIGLYRSLRSDFTRTMCATQQLDVPSPARRRRSVRVAANLNVRVLTLTGVITGKTTDIGPKGFSAVLGASLPLRDLVHFTIHCKHPELAGQARVANVRQVGAAEHRVGFSFRGLPAAEIERAETLVLDAVLLALGEGR